MLKSNLGKCKRLILSVVFSLTITACSASKLASDNQYPQLTAIAKPSTVVYVQENPVIYTSFKEIVNRSDVIVIGRPTSTKDILNTARDPNDPTRPDPSNFGVGQVYEVQVDSYLKGDGSLSIDVVQSHGLIPSKTQGLTDDDFEQARKRSHILPLTIGKRYFMFLSYSEFSYDGFPKGELLGGMGHPWRFEITDSECVQPEDAITDIYRYFPSRPLEEFVKLIHDPESIPEISSTAPGNSGSCTIESTTPYPPPYP